MLVRHTQRIPHVNYFFIIEPQLPLVLTAVMNAIFPNRKYLMQKKKSRILLLHRESKILMAEENRSLCVNKTSMNVAW